jgi:hypothetical protein
MTLTDISDLLPLMPRAVDFVWHRGRVATQYDETGTELPKPVLHFVLPLDASGRAEAAPSFGITVRTSSAIALIAR